MMPRLFEVPQSRRAQNTQVLSLALRLISNDPELLQAQTQ